MIHSAVHACDGHNNAQSSVSVSVKKAVEETDDRMTQFKKKAKELRVLDPKTAQNLCKFSLLPIVCVWNPLLSFSLCFSASEGARLTRVAQSNRGFSCTVIFLLTDRSHLLDFSQNLYRSQNKHVTGNRLAGVCVCSVLIAGAQSSVPQSCWAQLLLTDVCWFYRSCWSLAP